MAAFVVALLLCMVPFAGYAQVCNVHEYQFPADIALPASEATASTFQEYSWNTFLGLSAPFVGQLPDPTDRQSPQWSRWSTTVDMLSCSKASDTPGCICPGGDCRQPGSRYYPTACRGIEDYSDYRVLGQVGNIDDSFLQATTRGLSNNPLIDRFGNFLRFEILLSPVTYEQAIAEKLYDQQALLARTQDINMSCGTPEYPGGDPANPDMGALILKAAWMDVSDTEVADSLDLSTYHTDDFLIYSPAYRNSNGVENCELRSMALVGLHFEHKTLRQPGWIWSTFEHRDNAPNCEGLIPAPNPNDARVNTSCPVAVDKPYNFYGMECNDDGPGCASCNEAPSSNDPQGLCLNPAVGGTEGWCLDQPPAEQMGRSKVCRQVPVLADPLEPLPNPLPENYPQAAFWNHQCVTALADEGPNVWANYLLISTQWMTGASLPPPADPPALPDCNNVAQRVATGLYEPGDGGPVDRSALLPKVPIEGGSMQPFSGNSAMETYGRSNCIGCHAKGIVANRKGDILSTDFMYWVPFEVALQDANSPNYSGPWFDPDLDGEGYLVFDTSEGWLIYYFGYSASGDRLWLVSDIVDIGEPVYGQAYEFFMLVGTPGSFGTPLPSEDLEIWGTLWINLSSCVSGVFTMDGVDGKKVANAQKILGVDGYSCGP